MSSNVDAIRIFPESIVSEPVDNGSCELLLNAFHEIVVPSSEA